MVVAQQFHFPSDLLSDEPQLETLRHLQQIILLITCLKWWWRDRTDFFAEGNISIYYTPEQLTTRKFQGPDFFVVLGVEQKERNSWIVEYEGGKYPNVIVEILSPKTAKVDKGAKKQLYQDTFKTPEYFWFDPHPRKLELKGFRLENGEYTEIQPNAQGWLWSEQLKLYLGVVDECVRYFTPEGAIIPNFEEETARQQQVIAAIQQRADQERQRANQEQTKRQQLVERLRSLSPEQLKQLGINPEILA
jgi:Uma2 family endonuclease